MISKSPTTKKVFQYVYVEEIEIKKSPPKGNSKAQKSPEKSPFNQGKDRDKF